MEGVGRWVVMRKQACSPAPHPHPPTHPSPLGPTHPFTHQACEEQMGLEEEALAAVTAELAAEELVQGAVKAEVGGGACTHARGGWVGGEGDSAAPARTHPCLSIMPPPPPPAGGEEQGQPAAPEGVLRVKRALGVWV